MKKQLLCFLSLSFIISHSFAQPNDRQWLIWNSLGWDGTTSAYPTGVNISNAFSMHGVAHPDRISIPNARNDLFIIYSDGEHYNTRYEPIAGAFYPPSPTPPMLAVIDHNFNVNYGGGSISYMYMTNRYEEDDPPRNLKVSDGHGPGKISPYPLEKTNALLSANHDVTFTKDITIIVNYDSVMNNDFHQIRLGHSNSKPPDGDLVLKYDGIKHVSDGSMEFGLDYFDLKNAFDYGTPGSMMPGYPHNSYDTTAAPVRQVALTPANEKYRYINLRTNDNAYIYGPDKNGITQDSAVFTLYKRGVPVAMLTEPIRHSHDPNFLQVEKICRLDDGGHLVYYLLEFENTSPDPTPSPDESGPTDGLSVKVDFPAMFDLTCLEKVGWFSGGSSSCHIKINTTGARQRQFEFKNEGQLVDCNNPGEDQCIGRIRFMVKVNAGIDVSDLRTNLKLENMRVYFGQAPFQIHNFKDLKECQKVKGDPNGNQNEPEAEVNDSEKDAKKHLTKNSQGHENYDTNSYNNDTANNNLEAHDPNGYRRCYRPISPGKCKCGSGPGTGIPDALILAVAGIALLIIVGKYFKSRNPNNNSQPPQGNTAPPPPQGS